MARAMVLAGHGLNCEFETKLAFELAGGSAEIVHVDDLIAAPAKLADFQVLAIPGGFSYGDHTGAGVALAARMGARIGDALGEHVARGGMAIGVCNGCQVLTALGLVGGGRESVTILPNASGAYQCRWVNLAVDAPSPWTDGIERLFVPVAHGEGRYHFADAPPDAMVAVRYVGDDGAPAGGAFPANPNGSPGDVAGLIDATGRVLAMMPHPERALFTHNRPDWPRVVDAARRAGTRPPEHADGLALFQNAVRHFK